MKGYKVFNPDWTCKDMQYEVGKSYEMEGKPVICKRGFHFCEKIVDCFQYYKFDSDNKVAEIEAFGELDFEEDEKKYCTNKIKIIRKLNWHEVLNLVNTGKMNSGNNNSGNGNSGDGNSGDWNSGGWNSGNNNSGNGNSGDCNRGDWNSGNNNSGDWNSGNGNSGNWNSGDWNSASNCAGCFNTIPQPIMFFDNPANITFQQWRNSKACLLLRKIEFRPTEWICSNKMSDVEKEQHPEHETTGGYLKHKDNSKCCLEWWEGLTDSEKEIIKTIPNFDSEKFYQITGIKVE